jgi:hypothetical protein
MRKAAQHPRLKKQHTASSSSSSSHRLRIDAEAHIASVDFLLVMGIPTKLLIGLVFATSSVAMDPPAVKWAKGYTFGNSESHPHGGVQTADGGFLMVGDGVDYNNQTVVQRHIFVLKTSKTGELQWQQQLGDCGKNYGKFGIELSDGTFLISGARCAKKKSGRGTMLARALFRLDLNGNVLHEQTFDNLGEATNKRDGFMCVSLTAEHNTVIATGFVGSENATTGYDDEPMFLIYGGSAFVMKLTYGTLKKEPLTVVFDTKIAVGKNAGFEPSQGMRLYHDETNDAYAISIATANQPGNFQFGIASTTTNGDLNWFKMFVAEHDDLSGHASHPYALTLPVDGSGYVIGGLAVIFDNRNIEQCQGRVAKISPKGELLWDKRFTSQQKPLGDTNIECYGIQNTADGGYILTCGTGVEPELHPKDTDREKTWMVLAHRTDSEGEELWDTTYTTNKNLQNNAGEYIVTTKEGGYAIYTDSQTYGSGSTGGNFAIIMVAKDDYDGAPTKKPQEEQEVGRQKGSEISNMRWSAHRRHAAMDSTPRRG